MRQRWASLWLVLALSAVTPHVLSAQSTPTQSRQRSSGGLGQNYPNPFNPETWIPFSIGEAPNCTDQSRQYRVTLRVYNLLSQLVAVPVLQGGTGGVAGGDLLRYSVLECGPYAGGRVGGEVR